MIQGKFIAHLFVSCFFAATAIAETKVDIETSAGTMTFKLFTDDAPLTAANFTRLAETGWYKGKTFYRVVEGHVIQAGSEEDNDQPMVQAEFNKNPHIKGALGLARGEDPDSGSTEIYICHDARPHLDGNYTVFGQMQQGFDVLDRIAKAPVKEQWIGKERQVAFHQPLQPVVIQSIRVRE